MRLFSLEGGFTRLTGRIFDLVLLHLLWLVFSLPLVTLGASTTALYAMTLKLAKNEEPYLLKGFVKAFRENFKKATGLFVLLVLVFSWLILGLWICQRGESCLLRLCGLADAALLVLAFFAAWYVFPMQARYENTIGGILKNALLLSLRYLPYSLGLAACVLVPYLLTGFVPAAFAVMIAFWLTCGSSAVAFLQARLLLRVFEQTESHL